MVIASSSSVRSCKITIVCKSGMKHPSQTVRPTSTCEQSRVFSGRELFVRTFRRSPLASKDASDGAVRPPESPAAVARARGWPRSRHGTPCENGDNIEPLDMMAQRTQGFD